MKRPAIPPSKPRMEAICLVEGCPKKVQARGWCSMHYARNRLGRDMHIRASRCTDANARFEANYVPVPETGCWLWTGALGSGGYGQIMVGGASYRAHRYSLSKLLGRPIRPGMCACHKCDTRSCVNPDHLFEGTRADNLADMVEKGRSCRGESNYNTKLTEADVQAIRASDEMHRVIAARYGVSRTSITHIRSGKRWAHLLATVEHMGRRK